MGGLFILLFKQMDLWMFETATGDQQTEWGIKSVCLKLF